MPPEVTHTDPPEADAVPHADADPGPETDEAAMAIPTPLNGQITDAVTQADVITLGSAPAQAMASLYQANAHALSLALANATAGQQSAATLSQAVLAACLKSLGVPTGATT